MQALIYKRLEENENGENRYNEEAIKLQVNGVITQNITKQQIIAGVNNVNTNLNLVTLQTNINDIIKLNNIQVGDKVEFKGKRYTIKNITLTIKGFNGLGARRYIISL